MSGPRRSNAELLQQLEEKNPLLGLGCSYSPYPVRLWIQDMKNYYVDFLPLRVKARPLHPFQGALAAAQRSGRQGRS